MSNKCDPKLNIQIPENLLLGLNILSEISQNRPLTTQDVLDVFSQEELEELSQQSPSRPSNSQTDTQPTGSSSSSSSPSRNSGGGGSGAASTSTSSRKTCNPKGEKIGAWNTPVTSYGSVLGIPIEPRDPNCPCGKSE